MFPNEARLRNMTYAITIEYDVLIEFTLINENNEKIKKSLKLEKIVLGRFPIMLHSNLCILKNLSSDLKYNFGECKHDYGGYFIIDGKEKLIIPQEKFADNMLYIKENEESNILNNMKVSEIMRRDVVTIPEKMTLGKFIEFLPTTQLTTFPLIDENDNLSGIISVQDYRGWVLEEELKDVVIMKDLASTQVNTVTPEESMLEVLRHWDKGDMLPVVSKDGSKKIIGILSRRDALIAYNKALNEDNN